MSMKGRWTAILAGGLALALAGCSGGDPESLMARAEQARTQGDNQAAVVHLKNILKEEPDNVRARVMLSRAALARGNTESTISQVHKAEALGAAPGELQPQLARAYLGQGEYEKLLDEIDPEVAEDAATRAALEAARGHALLELGRRSQAGEAFQRAIEADSESLEARLGQARLALVEGHTDAAAQALDSAAAIAPDHARVALRRGDLAVTEERLDDAASFYRQAIKGSGSEMLPRERFQARLKLARIHLRRDELDEAGALVKTMLEQSGRHPAANYLDGVIAYRRGELDTAASRFQSVLSVLPDNRRATLLLGAVKLEQQQYGQARTYLGEAVARQPNDLRARLLYARALSEAGAADQATAVLTEGMALAGDDPERLAILGEAVSRDSRVEDMLSALESRPSAEAGAVRVNLGQALLGAGRTEEALRVLSEDDGEGGDDFLRRRLAIISAVRAGEHDRALEQTQTLLADYPDNAQAHLLAGGVHMALDNDDQAREQFRKARELAPDSALADYQLGRLALARDELKQAEKALESALSKDPESARVMTALARVRLAQDRQDEAVALLEDARAADAQARQPRQLLARIYVSSGAIDKAREVTEELVELAPREGRFLALRGFIELTDGKAQAAVDTLTRAVELSPDNASIRLALARAQSAAGQHAAAVATLQALREDHPDAHRVAYLLATSQYRAGDAKAAMATAEALDEQTAGNGMGALLKGELLMRAEDYPAAAEALRRAADAGRREALPSLLQAAVKAGEDEPAAGLESWLADHPDDTEVRFKLANWYSGRDEYRAALPHFERLAESGNAAALNNLAWVYQQLDDPRAVEVAKRARELAPQSPAVLDTLGWIQTLNGNADAGATNLAKAVEGAPDAAEIRYHYAEALARSGRREAALEHVARALQGDQPFNGREQAEKLQESLRNEG